MVQLLAFRRSLRLIALALCSAAIAVSATPASARSHHGAGRHARAYHAGLMRGITPMSGIGISRVLSGWDRGVAQMQAKGFADANASFADTNSTLTPTGGMAASSSFGSSGVVAEARRYIGGNPDRPRQPVVRALHEHGVAAFRLSRHRLGHGELVRNLRPARLRPAGRRHRRDGRGRGGGHVGIITGIDASGNPIMISGNNGNRVKEAPISRGRIYAYVMPTGAQAQARPAGGSGRG